MAHARDLYKTKLCTLYQRGNCPRQSCSFAHGEAELRRFPGGGFNGQQENHRSGDLRDRLDRRGSSPRRRRSPSRGGRQGNHSERRFSPRDRGRSHSRSPDRRRVSRSYTPPRSPSHKSERRESKKMRVEAPDAHLSDVSGDHYGGDMDKTAEANKMKTSGMSASPSPRDTLQEQLRQVQLDNEALIDEKEILEKALGKKFEETSKLTSQTAELEAKLATSQDEYKRWGSKLKKLIRVYMRCNRAQEEVKKTQSKLQKLAEEYPTEESHRPSTHADDSDFYNLSDGEPERLTNGINAEDVTTHYAKIDLDLDGVAAGRNGIFALNATPVAKESDLETVAKKKRLHAVREKTRASIRNMQQNGGAGRGALQEDVNRAGHLQILRPSVSSTMEKSGKVDMFTPAETGPSKDRRSGGDISPSLRSSPIDKVRRDVRLNLPPTGLAAHARDFQHETEAEEDHGNVGERIALNLNMPPNKSYQKDADLFGIHHLPTQYSQYKGDDEDVNVDGIDTDMGENVRLASQGTSGEQVVAIGIS